MPARKGDKSGMVKGKEKALADLNIQETRKMIPVLPEEQDYRYMTLDQIADHINKYGEGQTIRKITAFQMAVQNIALGSNIKDVNDLRKRFYTYCALAEACNMRIGNMNAYNAMGITFATASEWRRGGSGATAERRQLIREVDAVCSGTREMLAGTQQINPVLAIFWQKNFDGLRDVQDHVVSAGDPLGDRQTPEQIQEKYQDIIEE